MKIFGLQEYMFSLASATSEASTSDANQRCCRCCLPCRFSYHCLCLVLVSIVVRTVLILAWRKGTKPMRPDQAKRAHHRSKTSSAPPHSLIFPDSEAGSVLAYRPTARIHSHPGRDTIP